MNREWNHQSGEFTPGQAAMTAQASGEDIHATGDMRDIPPRVGMSDKAGPGVRLTGPLRPNGKRELVGAPFLRSSCRWWWLCGLLVAGLPLGDQNRTDAAEIASRSRWIKLADEDGLISQGRGPASASARLVVTQRSENQGVGAACDSQTHQIRELGQLCQTQKWLKRYKTGMFANLAMLANTFSCFARFANANHAVIPGKHSVWRGTGQLRESFMHSLLWELTASASKLAFVSAERDGDFG